MTEGRKEREEGYIPPVKTTITVPGELWRELKIRAVREGKNLSELIVEIFREHLGGKEGKA